MAAFRDELIVAAKAPELLELRGIMVLGSNGSWLAAAPAVEGERALTAPPIADDSAVLLAVAAGCAAPVGVVDEPVVPVMPWLMLMSWSSWLREII